jgi:hypothetical protein
MRVFKTGPFARFAEHEDRAFFVYGFAKGDRDNIRGRRRSGG